VPSSTLPPSCAAGELATAIFAQAGQDGLFPIYGDIPHLTCVSIPDGRVVATDWEVYRQAQHGWRAVIAADLYE
jgi:hypothetical protein